MVAERTAVRFEREQDSWTYMTGDAGERCARIPGWNREADTYFSCARRARQFVEGTEKQERYLCGPRLEAQLTGRICRRGVQARLVVPSAWRANIAAVCQDRLRQACITRHGITLAGVLLQV